MTDLSRRDLLKAGAAGALVPLPVGAQTPTSDSHAKNQAGSGQPGPAQGGSGATSGAHNRPLFFFNDEEARVVNAAIDRLIPGDDWAGAKDADVLVYIDRQLAGAYGAGARMYLNGPWDPDAPPQQGYQLRHSPAELYRIGIAEIRKYVAGRYGKSELWDLGPDEIDSVLSALESGEAELPSIPSPVFFETLLANTVEGYFSDPVYGGNRDMVSWRMIGFPGAYAQYLELVDQWGYRYDRAPMSLAGAMEQHDHGSTEE